MKHIKKIVTGITMMAMMLGAAVIMPGKADAQVVATNLGDLAVLEVLFSQNDSTGILNNGEGIDLGNVLVLDQLFGTSRPVNGRARANNRASLGDLIILNQLFNRNNLFNVGSSAVVTGTTAGTGTAATTGRVNTLGQLFILDRLFGNDNLFMN